MARIKGVTTFAGNFESEKAAPLVDMFCQTVADMVDPVQQEAHDGAAYMYYGRRAIVFSDPDPTKNGTYQLIDEANPTLLSSWQIFSTGGSAPSGGDVETVPKTFYISTTGDDGTGDGSLGNPYATIAPIKSVLKPIIATTITIVYLAGTYTVDATTFKFNGFVIDGGDFANRIRITGELVSVDTVTLVDNSTWEHEDSSKSFTVNEHVGRFLANGADAITTLPTVKPIMENTATVIKAGYSGFVPTDIVEHATFFVVAAGEKLTLDNVMTGSGRFYISYVNIDAGATPIDAVNTGVFTYLFSCYVKSTDPANAMTVNNTVAIYACFIEFHGRINTEEGREGNFWQIAYTCFHILRPTPAQNTDSWFRKSCFSIEGVSVGAYNSYMYWRTVRDVFARNNSLTTVSSFSPQYYKDCGAAYNFHGRGSVEIDAGCEVTFSALDTYIMSENDANGIEFDASGMVMVGTPNNMLLSGASNWNFTYDGVAHSIALPTSTLSKNVFVDVAKRRYISLPDQYNELSKVDYVQVNASSTADLVVGNISNRRIKIIMDIDGVSEYANVTINSLNIDDTSVSIQANSVLESQESGVLLSPSLLAGGVMFTLSINTSDEIEMNINNTTALDIDVRYYIERTNKA